MNKRPLPGRRIIVFMKNGKELDCCATNIIMDGFTGIMIYHKGRAINEEEAEGWLVKVKNAN